VHVVEDFDDRRAVEWFATLDYGITHYPTNPISD
jgi:hypothetical protein